MRKIGKIIIYFFILSCLLIVSSFAASLEPTEEVLDIILAFSDWQEQNDINLETEEGLSKAVDKLIELCDNDIEKVNNLNASYYYNGFNIWRAGPGNNETTNATNTLVETAIKRVKNGTQGNTGTKDEREELEAQIKSQMAGYKAKTDEELKKIDNLFLEYYQTYTENWNRDNPLYFLAEDLDREMQARGITSTSFQTIKGQEQEIRNEENQLEKQDPMTGLLGNSSASASHTPDEIIKEAKNFIDTGKNGSQTINGDNLILGSSTLYNLLLSIGIFLAVAIGMFLGVKFMTSSVEDKAKVKEALIPYIVGCIIIFGAFVIWKLTINLLSGIDKISYQSSYVIARQMDEK